MVQKNPHSYQLGNLSYCSISGRRAACVFADIPVLSLATSRGDNTILQPSMKEQTFRKGENKGGGWGWRKGLWRNFLHMVAVHCCLVACRPDGQICWASGGCKKNVSGQERGWVPEAAAVEMVFKTGQVQMCKQHSISRCSDLSHWHLWMGFCFEAQHPKGWMLLKKCGYSKKRKKKKKRHLVLQEEFSQKLWTVCIPKIWPCISRRNAFSLKEKKCCQKGALQKMFARIKAELLAKGKEHSLLQEKRCPPRFHTIFTKTTKNCLVVWSFKGQTKGPSTRYEYIGLFIKCLTEVRIY